MEEQLRRTILGTEIQRVMLPVKLSRYSQITSRKVAPGYEGDGPWRQRIHDASQAALILPAGIAGIGKGCVAPDMDIGLLGIGTHRFFLFHSGLLVWGIYQFYLNYLRRVNASHPSEARAGATPGDMRPGDASHEDSSTPGLPPGLRGVPLKIAGACLGGAAIGVGVHLAIDAFQPKAVIFPFIGSLVDGTLVDDNIWLLANAIWCFRVAYDVFALVLGEDLNRARIWAHDSLVRPLKSR